MNTVTNVKKVSFLFFIILTGTHILSSLMLANEYGIELMNMLNSSFTLPAIFAGILYTFSSMKLYLEEIGKNTKLFDIVAGAASGLLIVAAIILNFFV